METQKQPSRDVLIKRCSENMQQIYRRTPMPKCDFNNVAIEITLRHGCFPVNFLHIFRTYFQNIFSEVFLKQLWRTASTNNIIHVPTTGLAKISVIKYFLTSGNLACS